jgi:hypothetical protein
MTTGRTEKNGKGKDRDRMSADAIKEVLNDRRDAAGNVHIGDDDLVFACVLAMFFIQKLGKASLAKIVSSMADIGAIIDVHLADNACEALRARGLVSYATGRKAVSQGGESVRMYKPRQIVWANPPEVAHVIDLLPGLVSSKEAEDLIDRLNDVEREGDDGESKSKRKLGYEDYVTCRATFRTLNELCGSQPASPWLDENLRKSTFKTVEANLRFDRWPDNGDIRIASDVVCGWVATGLRQKGYGESAAEYISATDVRIRPTAPLRQAAFPIIDQKTGQGAGIGTYEILAPGQKFEVLFTLPERGLMTADDFKLFLAAYGPKPLRGLSPARGRKFGKVALADFEVLGKTKDDVATLESVMDLVSEEDREFYQSLIEEARRKAA